MAKIFSGAGAGGRSPTLVFSVSLRNNLDELISVLDQFDGPSGNSRAELAERICEKAREAHRTIVELVVYRRQLLEPGEQEESVAAFDRAERTLAHAMQTDLQRDGWCVKYHQSVAGKLGEIKDKARMKHYATPAA